MKGAAEKKKGCRLEKRRNREEGRRKTKKKIEREKNGAEE